MCDQTQLRSASAALTNASTNFQTHIFRWHYSPAIDGVDKEITSALRARRWVWQVGQPERWVGHISVNVNSPFVSNDIILTMLPSTSAVQSVVAVISVCCGLFSGQRWGSRCLFERRVSPEVNGRLRLGSPEAILFPGGYLMQQSHPTPEMEPQVEKEVLALDAQASLQRGLERVNVNWNYTPEPIMREALLCFTHSAKLGNMDAKALLGIFLYEGWQIPRDVDRGVMLSKEAADAGSPWGYFAYARCCFHGTGSVTRDVGLSAVLYHKAAECGLPKAQCNLGYW